MNLNNIGAYQHNMLGILRIASALVFLNYGTEKILGFPEGRSPPPLSLPWTAGVIELILGFTLLIGLWSRISAFVLSGLMAFAYFLVHAPDSFFPSINGGALAVMACFVFIYLSVSGPGAWSVDGLRDRRIPQAANTVRD